MTLVGEEIMFPALGHPAAQERERVGSKAAALSPCQLSASPFPPVSWSPRLLCPRPTPASPAPVWRADFRDAARAAGPGPYAVRSSAAAEDLPGASFAGMYESHLKVAPADLAAAVRRSFDSANADRIRVYESGQVGIGRRYPRIRAAMAGLVQQMVDPVAAGVAFTANPLSDDRNETVCCRTG